MLEWVVGLIFFLSVFVLIYFLKYREKQGEDPTTNLDSSPQNPNQDPKHDDIVLSKMTFLSSDIDYSILWNGTPGREYTYSIKNSSGNVIVNSKATSSSSVFKIRKIPLIDNQTYTVTVNNTTVVIPFYPPAFDLNTLKIGSGTIECDMSVVPTNMEIIFNGDPAGSIPLSDCQLKMEPPGFMCENSKIAGNQNMYVMMYNGENAANILILEGQKLI